MSETAESKTFRLSDRVTVEFTIGADGMTAEWTPDIPKCFTEQEVIAYRKARHEMLQRLAAKTGGVVVCVDG